MVELINDWVMSLKPQYVEAIRKGLESYVIRARLPRELQPGDKVFVVESGSGGKVVLCLTVGAKMMFTPKLAWYRYQGALGITEEEYKKYTRDKDRIYLLRITIVEEMPEGMTVRDLGFPKAPTWFYRIIRRK